MAVRLDSITIRGFKTIRELEKFQPGRITVLIGPNGAGKSNFISFFRLLSWALTPPGQLQEHVARLGGASAILHDGPEVTRDIEAHLSLVTDAGENEYFVRLAYAAGDTLTYAEEKYRLSRSDRGTADWQTLGAGHKEAKLSQTGKKRAMLDKRLRNSERATIDPRTVRSLLWKLIVYQFHNTSETARIRQKWPTHEGRWLKEDAGNLAPFLYRLQEQRPAYYQRTVETVRLILPFFADFELHQEFDTVLLAWRERGSDRIFTAGQAADGMLRILALVALLQQPEEDLPGVVIVDEPELGLHPYAIEVLAGLIRAASKTVQVIVATQSVSLIDRFAPEDIVVVDRPGRESRFRRLDAGEWDAWLQEYTLSELWEKNVIRGRPSA